jgi:hypothetical protein
MCILAQGFISSQNGPDQVNPLAGDPEPIAPPESSHQKDVFSSRFTLKKRTGPLFAQNILDKLEVLSYHDLKKVEKFVPKERT